MGAQEQVRRVLIVSADIGEGHNATGRALQTHVQRRWPQAQVQWADTLDVMGKFVGPLFRWTYVTNVERTPWLYEFFYRSLWRWPWFATASKRFVGSWAGRALRPVLGEFRPDLVLSTYPLGTAGLAWLRSRGELGVPVGAWISDFAPHPFWVYRNVDANVVLHDAAGETALRCVPGAPVTVGPPAVAERFVPGDRAAAREHLGLPRDGFVAVVSCGSLGFGSVPAAAEELLAAGPEVTVVAVCGRNEHLRRRVAAVSDDTRLVALGWTDDIPELLAACDVLVTNAGGVSALEALATGRPVLMYRPIAAHGRANARLMADAGLATVCPTEGSLTAEVRRLLAHPEDLVEMRRRVREHGERGGDIEEQLGALAGDESPTVHRLRAQDSVFVHVGDATAPQQLGAVLMFTPRPDGSSLTVDDAVELLAAVPGGDSFVVSRGRWRSPRLVTDLGRDPRRRLSTVDVAEEVAARGEDPVLDAEMADFFAQRIDPYDYGARARLVTGLLDGRSAFLVCAHHTFLDGVAMTGGLVAAAKGKPWPREVAPFEDGADGAPLRETVRGLVALARQGPAPRSSLNRPVRSGQRRFQRAVLNLADARKVATRLGVTTFDVAFGLLAEAVHREVPDAAPHIRLTVPQSTRTVRTFRSAGNHTGAGRVSLPTGPMPLEERIAASAAALRAQRDSPAPAAGRQVLRMIGLLPPWLHRLAARGAYSGRWFSMIATAIPGPRSPVMMRGSQLYTVFPVVCLAPQTRYAVGFMFWYGDLTVCVTAEPEGDAVAARWCADITEDFAKLVAACD